MILSLFSVKYLTRYRQLFIDYDVIMILLVAVCGSVRQDNVDIHSPITIHTTVISVAWNSLIFTLNLFLLWDQVITGFFIFVTILNIACMHFFHSKFWLLLCVDDGCVRWWANTCREAEGGAHLVTAWQVTRFFFSASVLLLIFVFYSFKRLSPIQFLLCASQALLRRGISQPWNCTQVGIPGIFKCGTLLARRSSRWL